MKNFGGADGEFVQSGIARSDGAIAICDSYDGLVEIEIAKPHSADNCAVRSALDALRDRFASVVQTHGNCWRAAVNWQISSAQPASGIQPDATSACTSRSGPRSLRERLLEFFASSVPGRLSRFFFPPFPGSPP